MLSNKRYTTENGHYVWFSAQTTVMDWTFSPFYKDIKDNEKTTLFDPSVNDQPFINLSEMADFTLLFSI